MSTPGAGSNIYNRCTTSLSLTSAAQTGPGACLQDFMSGGEPAQSAAATERRRDEFQKPAGRHTQGVAGLCFRDLIRFHSAIISPRAWLHTWRFYADIVRQSTYQATTISRQMCILNACYGRYLACARWSFQEIAALRSQ